MSKPEQINALAVTGLATAAITLAPGAEAHRASLLKTSSAITDVDEFTLDAASDALKLLQETARAVEKQRVKEKAPALDFGRQIDDCAKGYTAPINAEADRLSRLIGGYMAEQQRIAREAEEARQKAVREQARLAEEAARVDAQLAAGAVFVPEAPKGVKMVPDFEVTDLDALYRHNVGLVKMEPRREEILRAIAGQTIGDTLPTIPGLRVFLKPQVR